MPDLLVSKLSPVPMHSRLSPTLSSNRFSTSHFILRSLTHLDLGCEELVVFFFFFAFFYLCAYKWTGIGMFSFCHYILLTFVKNQVSMDIQVYFWVFDSSLLINLSVWCQYHLAFITIALSTDCNNGYDTSRGFFIVEDNFRHPVFLKCLLNHWLLYVTFQWVVLFKLSSQLKVADVSEAKYIFAILFSFYMDLWLTIDILILLCIGI